MAAINYLQEWQKKHGLVADGKVGPKTIKAMIDFYQVPNVSPKAFALFLAQVEHETLGYTKNRENMNYSWKGLMSTFNNSKITRFTPELAKKYGRVDGVHEADQKMCANIAYANRGGNGDADSGDGWRYRGGGCLHTTFRDNWVYYFNEIGMPRDTDPDSIVSDPDHFFRTGIIWMKQNGAWKYATGTSRAEVKALSNLINAGNANRAADPNGFNERLALSSKITAFV